VVVLPPGLRTFLQNVSTRVLVSSESLLRESYPSESTMYALVTVVAPRRWNKAFIAVAVDMVEITRSFY
jgi:hypothetical protein